MHNFHSHIRNDKRSRGIKLIQKRWRQTKNDSSPRGPQQKCKRELHDTNVTSYSDENTDSSVYPCTPVQPVLLFRRTNTDYSSMTGYRHLHFLNSSTILANDSHGHFDLVDISNYKGGKDAENISGRFLSNTMKLSSDQQSSLEVYGFQSGSKFAVGLPSGDLEIFLTERASSRNPDEAWCSSLAALRSCLPPVSTQHIGSHWIFKRSTQYSLQYMQDHLRQWQDTNDDYFLARFLPRDDESLNIDRAHRASSSNMSSQWAFREGGIGSSSALIGVCVDKECGCFSLRIHDERNMQPSERQNAFVAVPYLSQPQYNDQDDLVSICFTGEYGLVTGHNKATNTKMIFESILMWHDLRMVWNQPIKSLSLSCPQSEVAAILPSEEMVIKKEKSTSIPGGAGVAALHLVDRVEQQEHCSSFRVSKLTGSNDSSDRFAVTLQNPTGALQNNSKHLLVDSSLRKVVQDINGARICHDDCSPFCFSHYLDCMALSGDRLHAKLGSGEDVVSVYDISRHRSVANDGSICDNQNVLHRAIKRKPSSAPSIIHSSGYLGSFKPTFLDIYGLESTLTCMAMDDLGSTIAFGTSDGDIYILSQ